MGLLGRKLIKDDWKRFWFKTAIDILILLFFVLTMYNTKWAYDAGYKDCSSYCIPLYQNNSGNQSQYPQMPTVNWTLPVNQSVP